MSTNGSVMMSVEEHEYGKLLIKLIFSFFKWPLPFRCYRASLFYIEPLINEKEQVQVDILTQLNEIIRK